MRKVRWGVLSTADIGLTKVIPAMLTAKRVQMEGIASRSLEGAREAAEKLGIPKAYGSYEALLDDPEIDAVYIPLPNHLHVPWTTKALRAGKHVLCEKPIALSSMEARELLDAAGEYPHLKLMEGFMYRHHPQWVEAARIVRGGGLGEARAIQSFFSYFNVDGSNIRNKAELGGGAMMDIGCYCISLSRFIFEAEPQRVCGVMDRDPVFGVDRMFSGVMDFGGATSAFTCSTQLAPYQRVNILGTKGRLEIMIPFNAPPDVPCVMLLQSGEQTETLTFDVCDQYAVQADLMSKAILEDAPVPTPIQDALANMLVHEALMESAEKGVWLDC